MSEGPFSFAREAISLDSMLAQIGGAGWEGLSGEFRPAPVPDRFKPEDDLMRFIAAFYGTVEGRRFFEWIFDLTIRAPYPQTGQNFEQTAMAAGKHEARVAIGRVMCKAIADGRDLIDNRRSQNHADPA